MTSIATIDRQTLSLISTRFEEALTPIAAEFGLDLTRPPGDQVVLYRVVYLR